MACRQDGKLHSPAGEKYVAGAEKCVGKSIKKSCESRIDLVAGAGVEDIDLKSHSAGSRFDVSQRDFRQGGARIDEHSDTGDPRYQTDQKLQPFCGQLTADKIDARKVATRPGEASDKTGPDRIFRDDKHDGDGCGRSFCRQHRRTIRGNHRHPSSNQIRCEHRQSIRLILRPAVHYRDILSFDEAGMLQALLECAQAVSERLGRGAVEEPDHWHRGLLRPRRQRPRRRRAAEHRDELAPRHSTTSSARASSTSGTVKPSALTVLRLITSSYLVGACTGRSAGFSPLRMRST